MSNWKWKPIEPLTQCDRDIDLAATRPLYESWQLARDRFDSSYSASYQRFKDRLIRRLNIETGILERLYDLDRGTTEALVQRGFVEELVSHTSTDIQPGRLIDVLRDHDAAVQLAIDCVAQKRPLTKGVVHDFHATLTRHQDTTTAVDQLGRRVEIPLLKGAYKQQPNNPRRPDGSVHEYCPPVQVDSEMERLLDWIADYGDEDPVIVAAWLHHRFTQIHPYQDGNGRVARVLTTLVLLRADLLPLVVDRDLRTGYIEALESADAGDLQALALLFARLEQRAIVAALSVDAEAEIEQERRLTSAVIESLTAKLGRRRAEKDTELRKVNALAETLRQKAHDTTRGVLEKLEEPVSVIAEPTIQLVEGGPEHGNAHWYKYEIVKSAREAGTWVNLGEARYFAKAALRVGQDRLVFVISFHHIGRNLTGIMEATAFAILETFDDSEAREHSSRELRSCSPEPFVFTYKTDAEQIDGAFARWMDTALAIALKEFGDRI